MEQHVHLLRNSLLLELRADLCLDQLHEMFAAATEDIAESRVR